MTVRIGFIGLGNMGGRMARRLVEAGHDVLGFDPAPDAAGNAGAQVASSQVASSIGEVVAGSDHILFSLPDSHVVESVVLGEGGVLESARAGQIVVDLSTAAPASTQMLHARLGEIGIEFVDAGISGGAAAAEKGSLTLMVGGSEEALAQLGPTLEPLASKVFRMGGPGAGHSTKLLNNFLKTRSIPLRAARLWSQRRSRGWTSNKCLRSSTRPAVRTGPRRTAFQASFVATISRAG